MLCGFISSEDNSLSITYNNCIKNFKCQYENCSKTFSRKDHYNEHLRAHESNIDGKYSCFMDECTKSFTSKDHLYRHMNECHINIVKKYFCAYCNEGFRLKHEMKNHMLTDHGYHPFRCGTALI
jgi:hypothetical protein